MSKEQYVCFIGLAFCIIAKSVSLTIDECTITASRVTSKTTGHILRGQASRIFTSRSLMDCIAACIAEPQDRCLSVNYASSSGECHLNEDIMENWLEMFEANEEFGYYPRENRGLKYDCVWPVVTEDCRDLYLRRGYRESGIYTIYPPGIPAGLSVYCDMESHGGGWLVIQRRLDNTQDFYKDWLTYRAGFGDLNQNFWLGNDAIETLTDTGSKTWELRVDIEDWGGVKKYAVYSSFYLSAPKFTLHISGYSGDAGDSMTQHHDGVKFSTKDKDNDILLLESCAIKERSGWWFTDCSWANLNGYYYPSSPCPDGDGITWYDFRGWEYSLKFSEMKIRPHLQ